jgi:ribonuclease P protein component
VVEEGPVVQRKVGRLIRSQDFQKLRRGKRVEARFGQMRGIVAPRGDGEPALRVGLVVPKRLGNAPQRNRIKRRLRAGVADRRLAEMGGELGWIDGDVGARGLDLGIFPAKAVLDMNFDILVTQLGAAMRALARKLRGLGV